jgi:hypothetical protein
LEAEKEKRKQKGRCTIPEMKKEKEKGKRNEKTGGLARGDSSERSQTRRGWKGGKGG